MLNDIIYSLVLLTHFDSNSRHATTRCILQQWAHLAGFLLLQTADLLKNAIISCRGISGGSYNPITPYVIHYPSECISPLATGFGVSYLLNVVLQFSLTTLRSIRITIGTRHHFPATDFSVYNVPSGSINCCLFGRYLLSELWVQ